MSNEINTTIDQINCPFRAIGCIDDGFLSPLDVHLISETSFHSQLLIEAINHLTNDLHDVRLIVELQSQEIECQKLKICAMQENDNQNRNQIVMLEEEIASQKNQIQFLRTEVENKNIMLRDTMADVRVMKEEILTLQQYDAKRICDIGEMKEDLTAICQKFRDFNADFDITKGEIKQIMGIGDFKEVVQKHSTEIENIKSLTQVYNEKVEGVQSKMKTLILDAKYDFVWSIDKFSERNKWFQSHGFYKDNYRLCLRGWIGGMFGDYFMLYFCIMKGDRDSEAIWPMRHSVTLSIINQDTDQGQISWRCQYDSHEGSVTVFDRPTNQMNESVGGPWMYIKDIRKIQGLLVNDSVKVCCVMHPPAIG